MNRDNLKRMADYVLTIPQDMFQMSIFRQIIEDYNQPAECNTPGCIIGHSTVLSTKEMLDRHKSLIGQISFYTWAEEFTGISRYDKEFNWCFDSRWARVDNTPLGAAKRIRWMFEHGVPQDYYLQMTGKAELCYL